MRQPSVPVPPPPYPQPPPENPPPPPAEEINEVAIEVEQEEGEDGTVEETFTDYRPPKLPIGPCHPDPVVETSSLSAVHPPEPTYDLKIKDELESSGPLSCLQIETLVYACQRHLQHLPDGARAGFFIGDGAGVGKGRTIAGLILDNWRHGRRKALWISVGSDLKFDARRDLDDVGATNIEVHALNKLSYSKLDSKSVGVREGVIFLTYSCLIASTDRGRSRLQQLVQWCGSKYEGLVIFDECHKAKNLIPEPKGKGHPTQTGQAVLELQARLPEARIIYCSATGASEPRNMAYMVRLGLWGAGTCFVDFHEFLGTIQKRGIGALELVAMDMKARGMYVCRTLSYKGAEFEVVEIPLEARVMDMYNRASEFWAELRLDLLSASEFLTDKKSKSLLWRLYWANHQRFFSHMCMSAKVSAVVRLGKQALIENKCVVIGIQSTGEARTEEAVEKYGLELDGFISGPRELLLTFVEGYYPLPPKPEILPEVRGKNLPRKRHLAAPGVADGGRVRKVAKCEAGSDDESDEESEVDSEHESTEWEVESDADSDEEFETDFEPESSDEFQICETYDQEEPVHPKCLVPPVIDAVSSDFPCQSGHGKQDEYLQARNAPFSELLKRYEGALERRSNILDVIRSLELPDNPLDNIIDQLGGPCNVAEITGRRGRLVRNSDGKGVTYQARNTGLPVDMVNMHEKQLFMDGKKLVAIISEAGSAGVSLQADRRAINQKRRVHLTLELPWSADRAIQQFGRTHRSNQTSAPEYRLLFTNLGGERRFASIVAKRLESLGALTQGDRRAGPSLSAYNYDSAYGKKALMLMYKGIMEQDSLPVVPPGCKPENPGAIQDFTAKAKAALASVAIVKGTFSGHISDWLMHDVARFLNRILGLPPDMQNRLFELFVSIFDLVIRKARLEGHFDSGIVKMRANIIELRGTPKVVHHDPMSRASTVLFTFTLDRGTTWKSASALLDEKQKDGSDLTNIGFYESRKDWKGTRHFVLAIKGITIVKASNSKPIGNEWRGRPGSYTSFGLPLNTTTLANYVLVAIEVEQEEGEDGTVEETFTDYRPPKLPIGPCHPDPVVETSSLSAVHPPEPTYDLKIKDELESSGPLSCLQIETLVYACQRHLQHLPDGARAGFFIGDGAGVGKGRTIAGLILENWRHGRRKALWISVGSDLKFDARRDLDDVGATNIEVHALNKLSYSKLDSKSVGVREGVIFLTYSCLIASTDRGRSRLQQLVQWCGSKYEGLVIFDECHKAKNLIPEPKGKGHPTQTGQAVLELQALESRKRLRVVRIETTKEKQQFVGLLIPNAAVASVLQGVQDVSD